MLPIENWTIILIISGVILAIYAVFYKITMGKRLHNLTEEHSVSEPHNDLVLLKKFVEQCWQRGYSIPEIRSVLLKKGWNEDTINKVLYKSKVPNAEEKVINVKKALTNKPKASTPSKPKESKFAAIKSRVQKPKIKKPKAREPQVKVKPLKSEEKIKTIKKVSKSGDNQEDRYLKLGSDSNSQDEDYKESEEVTKLKKQVLKGVKD